MKPLAIAILTGILLLCSFTGQAPQQAPDELLLGTRALTWDDFKGRPNPARRSAATSLSLVEIEIKHLSRHSVKAIIKALFYPKKSFSRLKDASLLDHEQGHFDITEVYARKMRKELSAIVLSSNQYQNEVFDLYDRLNGKLDKFQDQYDKETDFSMNGDEQKRWNALIKTELEALQDYDNQEIALKIDGRD